MTTTPDRLAELANLIAARVPVLIDEARDQINECINATLEDAQAKEDGKAILSSPSLPSGISTATPWLSPCQ